MSPEVGARVLAEQVRTLYRQSVPVLAANVVNAAIVGAVVWDEVDHALILGWVAAMVVMSIARIELRRRFWARNPAPDSMARWGNYFVTGSAVAGVLWGFAGAAFVVADSMTSQLVVAFVIGGMGAGAAGTLGCHLRAFHAYFFPSLVPLVIRLAVFGDPTHLAMSGMVSLYTVALAAIAVRNGRSIASAFRLRFENEELVKRLTRTTAQLEEMNATLDLRVNERTLDLEREAKRRQRVEAALHNAQKLEAVGRVTSGIAHDFNNLLTVVLHSVDIAREHAGDDPKLVYCCDQALAAANRGTELIKGLRTFSRRHALEPEAVDPAASIERLAHSLLPHVCGAALTLETDTPASAWSVFLDSAQFESAIVNLAQNARDAMPDGGTLILRVDDVELDAKEADEREIPPGDYVRIELSDDGPGMEPEVAALAFQPFFTTKSVGMGSGLGLSTVYGFVRGSGGHVELQTSPGEGTTVTMYLPRYTEHGPLHAAFREPVVQDHA